MILGMIGVGTVVGDNNSNIFEFEDYCGSCDNFPGYNTPENCECPFKNKFYDKEYNGSTKWKEIGCDKFID